VGDEGKGKIVDLLAERFDVVVRYQGVTTPGIRSRSAISLSCFICCRPHRSRGKTCVWATHGDYPKAFFEEADRLMRRHQHHARSLKVSTRSALDLPYHARSITPAKNVS